MWVLRRCVLTVILALLPSAALAAQQWLVVSDIHLDPKEGGPPVEARFDTNLSLLDDSIVAMQRAVRNPAVVVMPGDFLAHHFPNDPDLAERTMRTIEERFNRAYPHAQFVVALGNNDDPCGDYRTSFDSAYLNAVARIWEPLVNRNGAAPEFARSFAHGGYYVARLPIANSRAIVLDTVAWSWLFHSCGTAVAPDEFAWLNSTLGSQRNERNIFVMHIPPDVNMLYLRIFANARLSGSIRNTHSNVAFVIAGHTHHLGFRRLGKIPMYLAPSISPIYETHPAFEVLNVDDDLHVNATVYARLTDGTWASGPAH